MLRSFALPSLLALTLAGCPYGDGSPCERPSDCAAGLDCCGETATVRGVCRTAGTCSTEFDAGGEDSPVLDAPVEPDAPAEDAGEVADASEPDVPTGG